MTWQEEAAQIIASVDRGMPADANLKERKRAISAAKPHRFACTSWGKKAWSRASTEYLKRYGYVPKSSPSKKPHLSPLERLMAASGIAPQDKEPRQ